MRCSRIHLPFGQSVIIVVRGAVAPRVLVGGEHPLGDRHRQRRLPIRDDVHVLVRRRIDVGVVEDDGAVVAHVLPEVLEVGRDGQLLVVAPHARVLGDVERHVRDDAERAVAAHRAVEQLGLDRRAGGDDAAVREHEGDVAHGAHERPLADVPTVRVHRQRAADGERVVRLHDLHGEADPVERLLHFAPARPRAHGDRPSRRVERDDAAELPHVELDAVGRRRLSAHAVAPAANRDRPGRCLARRSRCRRSCAA